MRLQALSPTIPTITSPQPPVAKAVPGLPAYRPDGLTQVAGTSSLPAVSPALQAATSGSPVVDLLQLADSADKAGPDYLEAAYGLYARAIAKATRAAEFFAIGDHAVARYYYTPGRVAREKGIAAAMADATSLEQRLAIAAKADGFGGDFSDETRRCYDEAIAKTTSPTELLAIAQHADRLIYPVQADHARRKAFAR